MRRTYAFFLAQLPFLLIACDAFARAGGGGSGGGGSGRGGIFKLVFIVIAYGIYWLMKRAIKKRHQRIVDAMPLLAAQEGHWKEQPLHARIHTIYEAVQKAWMDRDQEPARQFMSERLYHKHKDQTDEMIRNNTQNILDGIRLLEIRFVSLDDHPGSYDDTLGIYIKGAMVDYEINTKTGKPRFGANLKNREFEEFWYLTMQNGEWVLDEIDAELSMLAFRRFRFHSYKK